MKIEKILIYYFSGTGNARNVTHWIDQIAQENQIESEIKDISKLNNRKKIIVLENSTIGFVSPTHGFNFPPIMFHFILRFPKAKNNKAFIINTRAGMKMGKYFLPGLSGITQYFSAIILRLKGYKIVGMHPIDLPSNWISFHPGIKPKVVESIYVKRKRETERFARNMLNGKTDYKALKDLIQDILISPITFFYYIVGRFILAKSFYASHDCTNCNLCVQKCPVKAIKIVDKRPFWTYNCESCMQCMNICPERAIETAHGFVFGIYFLIKIVLIISIYKFLNLNNLFDYIQYNWLRTVLDFIVNASLLLFLFFSFYWIFHFLLRFRFFERFILYTSLTKWKFWRRYKSPNY